MKFFRFAMVSLLSLGIALPALAAEQPAQQRAEQRFSDSADIVAVEVPVQVVRDGKPVRGLSAADFEVYEGRQKQAVTGFEVVDLAAIPADARGAAAQAPRLPMSSRRKFVLMFDMGFSSLPAMTKARQAAKDLLHGTFHPADLVAVAAVFPSKGPQLLVGFTSDRKLVEDAIDHLDPVQMRGSGMQIAASDPLMLGDGDGPELQSRIASEAQDQISDRNGTNLGSGLQDGINPLTSPLERSERTANQRDMEQFAKNITLFANTLASVKGRKYVILLSEGFDSTVATGVADVDEVEEMDTHSIRGDVWNIDSDKRYGNTRAGSMMERMLDSLRRADCVVQAVDIGGVRAGEDLKVVKSRGRDSLFMMANATGGEFYPNFNNLGAAMEKVLDRTSVTYVLTFQPDVKRDGQYHKLRVELKNPQGARVVYRPGYYAPKPYAQQTAMEKVLGASGQVAAGREGGAVQVSLLAAPFQQEGGKAYVPVLVEVDGPSLLGSTEGTVLPAEIFVYAFDSEGRVRDYFSEKMGFDLAKVGAAVRQTGVKLFGHLDLPSGSYSVRALVRNGLTGAAGLKVASLEVPAFAQAGPVLLPPFFPETPGRWLVVREAKARQGKAEYPFMARDKPYIPASRPALEPERDAAMALVGYHLAAGPLTAHALVMTAEGKEAGEGKVALLNRETASGGPDRLTATFRPPRLQPGEYELLLTVTDSQGTASTSVTPFVVNAPGGAAVAKAGGGAR
jgi:VWFA-related protein